MSTDIMTWVSPSGVETSWPVKMLKGVVGRGMPPMDFQSFANPGRAGSTVTMNRHAARRISVPILFANRDCTAAVEAAVRTKIRTWANQLSTTAGPGKLRFTTVVGDSREISAYYVGGLELQEDSTRALRATVEFSCVDTYFEDTTDTVISSAGLTAVVSWFPFFPLVLTASEVSVEQTITNTGDVETWPVISVKGPATDPSLVNMTTGERLSLSATIGAGETVTFDARPGKKTVKRQDGVSLYGSLSSKQWWSLGVGATRVQLQATGTTADSVLSVQYRRRWLTV